MAFTPANNNEFKDALAYYFSTGTAAAGGSLSGQESNIGRHSGALHDGTAVAAAIIGTWVVSAVTDMSEAFKDKTTFNEDISGWQRVAVSGGLAASTLANVRDMSGMFYGATSFNQNIGGWGPHRHGRWDVSNVTNMAGMFRKAEEFNQDIGDWNVSSVTTMEAMFKRAYYFNQDISDWNVSEVKNMKAMFYEATVFNQDISGWNVSKVENMFQMFKKAREFNQTIGIWDVTNVTNMFAMFQNAVSFNGGGSHLNAWDVSKVTNMGYMFDGATNFNQDISNWAVSLNDPNDTNGIWYMFRNAINFNQDISGWNVSQVSDMLGMFEGARAFNNGGVSLNNWERPNANPASTVANVTNMERMFKGASNFNANISNWNVGSVQHTKSMFEGASAFNNAGASLNNWSFNIVSTMTSMFKGASAFNADISNWDVSTVWYMGSMFEGASAFNANISGWTVTNVRDMSGMFKGATVFNQNIGGWNVSQVENMASMFQDATAFNANITGWDVSKVTNMNSMFKNKSNFNQDISDWERIKDQHLPSSNQSITAATSSTLAKVTDMASMFEGANDFDKDISGWSVSKVTNMASMFKGAANFNAPLGNWQRAGVGQFPASTLEKVTNMASMFEGASKFDKDISGWIVSEVTNMASMFKGAEEFDKDISGWSVGNVTDMSSMFENAKKFNRGIGGWNVSNVTNMEAMFKKASVFATDISVWDVKEVTNMKSMFEDAVAFPHSIHQWRLGLIIPDMTNMFNGANTFNSNYSGHKGWDNQTPQPHFFTTTFRPKTKEELKNALIWYQTRTGTRPDNYAKHIHGFAGGGADNEILINNWDVSLITDMSELFNDANLKTLFNGDISEWNVGNVTNMKSMFEGLKKFDRNLSNWDVSKVTNMSCMFKNTEKFNNGKHDIVGLTTKMPSASLNKWNVGNVTDMSSMFEGSLKFNAKVGNWDVSKVKTFKNMFKGASEYDQHDIRYWGIDLANDFRDNGGHIELDGFINFLNGTKIIPLVSGALQLSAKYTNVFNSETDNVASPPITYYVPKKEFFIPRFKPANKSKLIDALYYYCTNGNLPLPSSGNTAPYDATKLGVSNDAVLADNINYWDTSEIIDMSNLFQEVYNVMPLADQPTFNFNKDISGWDVSNVRDMSGMFKVSVTSFAFNNGDVALEGWDVSSVKNMSEMFSGASKFNVNIGSWNVGNVTNMSSMFQETALFDQDISGWNVSSVQDMSSMFEGTLVFNNNNNSLNNWERVAAGDTTASTMANVTNMSSMFKDTVAFDQDINGWNVSSVQDMSSMFQDTDAFNKDISNWSVSSVQDMSSMFKEARSFNNGGHSLNGWERVAGVGVVASTVGNVTKMNQMFMGDSTPGSVVKNIFNQDISDWDVSKVTNMNEMFSYSVFNNGGASGTSNNSLNGWQRAATGTLPASTVGNVTIMSSMFSNNTDFNQDISGWDVGKVQNMSSMFKNASDFNQDIGAWNVSSVQNMTSMFEDAIVFNNSGTSGASANPLNNWERPTANPASTMANVTNMSSMFKNAAAFNQTIGGWNVSSVQNMSSMFESATKFHQDIGGWTVSLVQYMNSMFKNADAFNQNIGGWDVSKVTDMSSMFEHADNFNKDISGWDVSLVTDMSSMFKNASVFDQKLWKWTLKDNTVGLTDMFENTNGTIIPTGTPTIAFFGNTYKPVSQAQLIQALKYFHLGATERALQGITKPTNYVDAYHGFTKTTNAQQQEVASAAYFIGLINDWDVSLVTNMSGLFDQNGLRDFNQDISGWDVSNVTNMSAMFKEAQFFNQDISAWNVSSVTDMSSMFEGVGSFYNLNINDWDVSEVTDMRSMFKGATYVNPDISGWNVSKVENMSSMFEGAKNFNQNIGAWNVSKVTDMSSMFKNADDFINLSQSLNGWERDAGVHVVASTVGNVTNMSSMFEGATTFNQDIGNWQINTSAVVNMTSMFKNANDFNQDISAWNVSLVTNMSSMFEGATTFNQDIGNWQINTSAIVNMTSMFKNANGFNKDISGWNVSKVENMTSMFEGATAFNEDISGWDVSSVQNMSKMFMGIKGGGLVVNVTITNANAITNITVTSGGRGYKLGDIITFDKVEGGNNNAVAYDSFTYTLVASDFHNTATGVLSVGTLSGTPTIQNGVAGTTNSAAHTVSDGSTGLPAAINNTFNRDISGWNVSSVDASGDGMSEMFAYSNFNNGGSSLNNWQINTNAVVNMSSMFKGAIAFNQNIGAWDVSEVTHMTSMFENAVAFNKNIGAWDVSDVESMENMFKGAKSFNRNIREWDVSKVTDMTSMFENAVSFNKNIGAWDVSDVESMENMFKGATSFNRNIREWDIARTAPTPAVAIADIFKGATAMKNRFEHKIIIKHCFEKDPVDGIENIDNIGYFSVSALDIHNDLDPKLFFTKHPNWGVTDDTVENAYKTMIVNAIVGARVGGVTNKIAGVNAVDKDATQAAAAAATTAANILDSNAETQAQHDDADAAVAAADAQTNTAASDPPTTLEIGNLDFTGFGNFINFTKETHTLIIKAEWDGHVSVTVGEQQPESTKALQSTAKYNITPERFKPDSQVRTDVQVATQAAADALTLTTNAATALAGSRGPAAEETLLGNLEATVIAANSLADINYYGFDIGAAAFKTKILAAKTFSNNHDLQSNVPDITPGITPLAHFRTMLSDAAGAAVTASDAADADESIKLHENKTALQKAMNYGISINMIDTGGIPAPESNEEPKLTLANGGKKYRVGDVLVFNERQPVVGKASYGEIQLSQLAASNFKGPLIENVVQSPIDTSTTIPSYQTAEGINLVKDLKTDLQLVEGDDLVITGGAVTAAGATRYHNGVARQEAAFKITVTSPTQLELDIEAGDNNSGTGYSEGDEITFSDGNNNKAFPDFTYTIAQINLDKGKIKKLTANTITLPSLLNDSYSIEDDAATGATAAFWDQNVDAATDGLTVTRTNYMSFKIRQYQEPFGTKLKSITVTDGGSGYKVDDVITFAKNEKGDGNTINGAYDLFTYTLVASDFSNLATGVLNTGTLTGDLPDITGVSQAGITEHTTTGATISGGDGSNLVVTVKTTISDKNVDYVESATAGNYQIITRSTWVSSLNEGTGGISYSWDTASIQLHNNDVSPPGGQSGNGYKTGDAYLIPNTSGWDTFFKTDADLIDFTNRINIEEIEDASLKNGTNNATKFRDALGNTPTVTITNGFMKHDNFVKGGDLRGTLPAITGGNAATGTTTDVAPSGGSGTGLKVTVKTLNGDATALDSITVTDGGSGYKVDDVITFAKVGTGTTAGDYDSFTYTLVAGDFSNLTTVRLAELNGALPTITGGNAATGTTTNVAPSGGSGTGLKVTVKTKDGDATKLESITVTDGGSGYKVDDEITFAALGNGNNPGDYAQFSYTLVAADVEGSAENVYIDSDKIIVTNKNVTDSNANDATFQLIREANNEIKIKVINEGNDYQAGDILTIASINNPAGGKYFDEFDVTLTKALIKNQVAGTITNLDGLTITQAVAAKNKNRVGVASFNVATNTTHAPARAGSENAEVHIKVQIPDVVKAQANYDDYLHYGIALLKGRLVTSWDVSKVENMSSMFEGNGVSFDGARLTNQDISEWDVSLVTDMSSMFKNADNFNQDISEWDVSLVTDMSSMFKNADNFNQDIGEWDVGAVLDMSSMFNDAAIFNQDIGGWNVSKVKNMKEMFHAAPVFNQDISGWNVSEVENMSFMFFNALAFNKSLKNWERVADGNTDASTLANVTNMDGMLNTNPTNNTQYDHYLGWKFKDENVSFVGFTGGGGLKVDVKTKDLTAGTLLDSITVTNIGSGYKVDDVITFAKVGDGSNAGDYDSFDYTLVAGDFDTNGELKTGKVTGDLPSITGGNYDTDTTVDAVISDPILLEWLAQTIFKFTPNSKTELNTAIKHFVDNIQVPNGGKYFKPIHSLGHLKITTGLPQIRGGKSGMAYWDVSNVTDMSDLFNGVNNDNFAIGVSGGADVEHGIKHWDVSHVTDMSSMFIAIPNFNIDISGWDVSSVTNMSSMFKGNTAFTKDISGWDVSNVINMSSMFEGATNFNVDISAWGERTRSVTNMSSMFEGATSFNGDISAWNVGAVTNMRSMFQNAGAFNNDGNSLNNWERVAQGNTDASTMANVTNMSSMFQNAAVFDKPIGNWDVGKVTNMESMFNGAGNFNQDISDWDVSGVTGAGNMKNMFKGAIDFNKPVYKWTLNAIAPDVNDMFSGATEMHNSYGATSPATYDGFDNTPSTTDESFFTTVFAPAQADLQADLKYYMGVAGATKPDNYSDHIHGHKTAHGGAFAANINDWDVSLVTDMSDLFNDNDLKDFNQNIGGWDVSKVTNMAGMFEGASKFNQDIGNWQINTNNDVDMSEMFLSANNFNQDISRWDVSHVTTMQLMFRGATDFNNGGASANLLNTWNVSKVTNMNSMFENAFAFNQDIGGWDVSNVTNMAGMFKTARVFNQNIGNWQINTSDDVDMSLMFDNAHAFNQDIGGWNVSKVTNMAGMFKNAMVFNNGGASETSANPLNGWNVGAVTNMSSMFKDAIEFNQDISAWDVSKVTTMESMFENAKKFNQDIGNWQINNTADVIMKSMFKSAKNFNNGGAIGESLHGMNKLDMSRVTNMESMFEYAESFNQPIGKWDVSKVTHMTSMFYYAQVFDQDIGGWDVGLVQDMQKMFQDALAFNQDISGWTVSNVTDMESMFEYAISFNGDISIWQINTASDVDMHRMFTNAQNFNQDISNWDVSKVDNMKHMFERAISFNQDIGGWDVSNVKYMQSMFKNTSNFNADISSWDVSSVENIHSMFEGAITFNKKINTNRVTTGSAYNAWDVSNVTNMKKMFYGASNFNQDIGSWNVSNVENMRKMFACAPNFNKNISTKPLTAIDIYVSNTTYTLAPYNAWDVSNVTNMESMFHATLPPETDNAGEYSKFDQGIGEWDVSKVKNMTSMFQNADLFDQDIRNWEVIETINKVWVAGEPVNGHGIDGAVKVDNMFENATKMQSKHAYLGDIFYSNLYNGPNPDLFFHSDNNFSYKPANSSEFLEALIYYFGWHVAGFARPSHYPIGAGKYYLSASRSDAEERLSKSISNWDVSLVTNMREAFCSYGERWEEAIKNMQRVGAVPYTSVPADIKTLTNEFNEDISGWDVSAVANMDSMFKQACKFNQDISGWDVSNVTSMNRMFCGTNGNETEFDQDIRKWTLHPMIGLGASPEGLNHMFDFSKFGKKYKHYNGLMIKADGTSDLGNSATFDFVTYNAVLYRTGVSNDVKNNGLNRDITAHISLTWLMSSPPATSTAREFFLGKNYGRFKPTNKIELIKAITFRSFNNRLHNGLPDNDIVIFQHDSVNNNVWKRVTAPYGYNDNIETWDLSSMTETDLDFCFSNNNNINNIEIDTAWILHDKAKGTTEKTKLSVYNASPAVADVDKVYYKAWDVSNINSMKGTFYKAALFNQDISNWDVSEVTDMESMFEGAEEFNQDISLWNISKVTTMARMFNGANDFNQDIYTAVVNHDSATTPPYAAWNPTACTVMTSMFQGTRAFNKDIGNWNINSVTDMESMFEGAIAFNQDISTKGIHKLAIYENNAWQSDKINTNDNRFNSTLSTAKTGKYLAWDTKNIANMKKMFYGAIDFDKDNNSWSISNWNTMSVTTIEQMFNGANNFNQDIRSWSIGIDIEMAKDGTTGDDTWNINVFGDDHVTPLVENSFQEGYKHETGYNFGSPKLSFFSRVYFISSNEELERAVKHYLNKDSGSSSQSENPIVFSDQYSNNLNTLQASLKNLVANITTDWTEDFETPLKVIQAIPGVANSSFTDQKALLMNVGGGAGPVTVAVGDTLLDLALALFNQYYPTPARVQGENYDIDLMGDSNVEGVNNNGAFKNGGIDLAYKAVAIIHAFFTENQSTSKEESILSKPIVAPEDPLAALPNALGQIPVTIEYIDLLTIAKKGFIMTDLPDGMTEDEKALHFEDLKYAASRSCVSVWEYLSYHSTKAGIEPSPNKQIEKLTQLSTQLALLYWCKHIKLPELKLNVNDDRRDPDNSLNTMISAWSNVTDFISTAMKDQDIKSYIQHILSVKEVVITEAMRAAAAEAELQGEVEREALLDERRTMFVNLVQLQHELEAVQIAIKYEETVGVSDEGEYQGLLDIEKHFKLGIGDISDEISEIQGKLDKLAPGYIISLPARLKEANARIAYSKSNILDIDSDIEGLTNNLREKEGEKLLAQANLESLQGVLHDAENELADLNDAADGWEAVENKIQNKEDAIRKLQEQLNK